jgi:hypothetical protein
MTTLYHLERIYQEHKSLLLKTFSIQLQTLNGFSFKKKSFCKPIIIIADKMVDKELKFFCAASSLSSVFLQFHLFATSMTCNFRLGAKVFIDTITCIGKIFIFMKYSFHFIFKCTITLSKF